MKCLKVNGKTIRAKHFAYDGCHKIYLIEDKEDKKETQELGYELIPISELRDVYENSCSLKFISTWKLEGVVEQFEDAVWE